jgi:hypothetical protein
MRYTLWSRGRTLGYTELDLPHVDGCIRMGFIEPTDDGVRFLPDAIGVSAAAGALANAARRAARGHDDAITEFADFRAACDRREALNLELRDETGVLLEYEWIQVNDIDEGAWIEDDAADDDDLDHEWLQQFEQDVDPDPECQAAIEHDVGLMDAELDGDDWSGESAWGTADDRWNWFRYHLMVRLPR